MTANRAASERAASNRAACNRAAWVLAAPLLFISLALFAQGGSQSAKPSDEQLPTFRSDVKLVNVYATVLDRNGSPVADLSKGDFELLEDGRHEDIAIFDRESEVPLNIVLAVDTSLSTRKDLPLELASARRFVHLILRPIDRLALFSFDQNVQELVSFTSDLKTIDRGIEHVHTGSATSLFDAVYLAGEALAGRRGRKVMVIITDGGDTTSRMEYQDALRSAIQSEALVYSIIVVPVEASAGRETGGEHALIQMSRDTGGKYFYAGNPGELEDVFRQIDRELRTQYVLAYYPKPRTDGAQFRRITVHVKQPGGEAAPGGGAAPAYTVRNRTGYYTHPAQ